MGTQPYSQTYHQRRPWRQYVRRQYVRLLGDLLSPTVCGGHQKSSSFTRVAVASLRNFYCKRRRSASPMTEMANPVRSTICSTHIHASYLNTCKHRARRSVILTRLCVDYNHTAAILLRNTHSSHERHLNTSRFNLILCVLLIEKHAYTTRRRCLSHRRRRISILSSKLFSPDPPFTSHQA